MPIRRTHASHHDACAAAHGLDLVGDQWSLMVVREMVLGPKRFADLQADLPGLSPAGLTTRLRTLTEHGIVTQDELPPPARVRVYRLTPWGSQLETVLQALGRWAVQSSGLPQEAHLSPDAAILSLRTMARPAPADASPIRLQIELVTNARGAERRDDYVVDWQDDVRIERGRLADPEATITTDPDTLLEVLYSITDLDAALADGTASVEGDRRAIKRLRERCPTFTDMTTTHQTHRPVAGPAQEGAPR